jgi:mannosyl-oligosaccharide glucosidase
VEKATFLDSLKDQTKDRPENTPMDLMLHNEIGSGNMHLVQMTCHGKFEVSLLSYNMYEADRT